MFTSPQKLKVLEIPRYEFPEFFSRTCAPAEMDDTDQFLASCGPTTALGCLLRIPRAWMADLSEQSMLDPNSLINTLHDSYYISTETTADGSTNAPYGVVYEAWQQIVGPDSPWRGVLQYPNVHACILRGPTEYLRRFFSSPSIRNPRTPIAAIIRPVPIRIPERAIDWEVMHEVEHGLLQRMEDLHRSFRHLDRADRNSLPNQIADLLGDPELIAALDVLQSFVKWWPWIGMRYEPNTVEKVLGLLAREGGYLQNLGIGDIERFGPHAGHGETVVVMDSGADESSPWLQRQVVDYARFDPQAQAKRAFDCVDFACHGTKMSSVIAGKLPTLLELGFSDSYVRSVTKKSLSEFGLSETQRVRIAIAPGAKLAIGGVLGGELYSETGGIIQMVAGIDWAVSRARQGQRILNMSIEADARFFDKGSQQAIDALFRLIKRAGGVPLISSGNHGTDSTPISTEGFVIGGATPDGVACAANGPRVDLLAPGADILCGQPKLTRLRGLLINAYNGSSLATAITSGCLANLSARYNVSPSVAMQSLQVTAMNKMISVDRASQLLETSD